MAQKSRNAYWKSGQTEYGSPDMLCVVCSSVCESGMAESGRRRGWRGNINFFFRLVNIKQDISMF